MKLSDLTPGDEVAVPRYPSDSFSRSTEYDMVRILAHDVPFDERTGKIDPETAARFGITTGLGSGGSGVSVSLRGRLTRNRGTLAVCVQWEPYAAGDVETASNGSALDTRSASLVMIVTGHDLKTRDEIMADWERRALGGARYAMQQMADPAKKVSPYQFALCSTVAPSFTSAWLGSHDAYSGPTRLLHDKPVKIIAVDRYRSPYALTDSDEWPEHGDTRWIGPHGPLGVLVEDINGLRFLVDARFVVNSVVIDRVNSDVDADATQTVRDRMGSALKAIAAQVDADQGKVKIGTNTVTIPHTVLEALLFGDERGAAAMLDGIAELRDTLDDLRKER